MLKLKYSLNFIALLLCLISAWKYFSTQAENDFLQNELNNMQTKLAELELAVKEAKAGQIDKINREKRKNSELEDASDAMADEVADLERKRDEVKITLEIGTKKEEELSSEIQENKLKMTGIDSEVLKSEQSFRGLTLEIPNLQQEIANIHTQIAQEEQKKLELESLLTTYEDETRILKAHYDCTVEALKKDFYEHPWLERGERVKVSSSTLDLESGILMLSVGKNKGIEEKMLFSVQIDGKNICQIRIKNVAFDHCVAMIVPLLGTPKDLTGASDLDLIYL